MGHEFNSTEWNEGDVILGAQDSLRELGPADTAVHKATALCLCHEVEAGEGDRDTGSYLAAFGAFLRDPSGVAMIEYALIISVVGAFIMFSLESVGQSLICIFDTVDIGLGGEGTGGCAGDPPPDDPPPEAASPPPDDDDD